MTRGYYFLPVLLLTSCSHHTTIRDREHATTVCTHAGFSAEQCYYLHNDQDAAAHMEAVRDRLLADTPAFLQKRVIEDFDAFLADGLTPDVAARRDAVRWLKH